MSDIPREPVERETEIEKLLRISQIEQKKALSGYRGRASRTGRKGAVQFPYEWLDSKTKKQYIKAGEMVIYSMYDNIMTYEEFSVLPVEQQKTAMAKWRNSHAAQEIIDRMGVSRAKFYSTIKKLNLPVSKPVPKSIGYTKVEEDAALDEGLVLLLNGKFEGKRLAEKLVRLASIIEAEEVSYFITLELKESQ